MLRGWPWPPRSGSALRAINILEGLSRLGTVDIFALRSAAGTRPFPAAEDMRPAGHASVDRIRIVPRPRTGYQGLRRLGWLVARQPAELYGRRYGTARLLLREWMQDQYDLVWFQKAETYTAFEGIVDAPTIVDLDDLGDAKVRLALNSENWLSKRPTPLAALRAWRREIDANRWQRLQVEIARKADSVVVCSEDDRRALRAPNVEVVPNGCAIPDPSLLGPRRRSNSSAKVILFQGLQLYEPNIEAAHILARVVIPKLQTLVGNVQLRVVGRCDYRIGRLHDPPAIIVTGEVPRIEDELVHADLMAAPILQGGGTRLKILEALAHRVPVVATSVACAGLGLENGRHVLIADEPESFISACGRALMDEALRRDLVDLGFEFVRENYRWERVWQCVVDAARRAAAWGSSG